MRAKLVLLGNKALKRAASCSLPSTIGRSRRADVTVAHPMISRQHCEMVEKDGFLVLRDLGSTNGTFVKGVRIQEAAVEPGEPFSIGPLSFRVDYTKTTDLSQPPQPILAEESQSRSRAALSESDGSLETLDESRLAEASQSENDVDQPGE